MFDFDQIELWDDDLRSVLAGELPSNIQCVLAAAKPKYVEDAYNLLLQFGKRSAIIEETVAWLRAQAFVAYHGSRLDAEAIDAIEKEGLRPLRSEDRAKRINRALSRHPDWPEASNLLAEALRLHGDGNRAGVRQGQVHLTLSRSALVRGFNHYLVEGSEFDGHVAQHLLGPEGRQMLRADGRPVIFEVHVPAGNAFVACNPYGIFPDRVPNPVRSILAVWSYRLAYPAYQSKEYELDCGLVFHETVPASWISRAICMTDDELLPFYRP